MATVDVKGLSLTAAQDAPTIKFIAAELLSVYTVSKFLNSVLICAGLTVNWKTLPKTHQLGKIVHPLWLFGQSR